MCLCGGGCVCGWLAGVGGGWGGRVCRWGCCGTCGVWLLARRTDGRARAPAQYPSPLRRYNRHPLAVSVTTATSRFRKRPFSQTPPAFSENGRFPKRRQRFPKWAVFLNGRFRHGRQRRQCISPQPPAGPRRVSVAAATTTGVYCDIGWFATTCGDGGGGGITITPAAAAAAAAAASAAALATARAVAPLTAAPPPPTPPPPPPPP